MSNKCFYIRTFFSWKLSVFMYAYFLVLYCSVIFFKNFFLSKQIPVPDPLKVLILKIPHLLIMSLPQAHWGRLLPTTPCSRPSRWLQRLLKTRQTAARQDHGRTLLDRWDWLIYWHMMTIYVYIYEWKRQACHCVLLKCKILPKTTI